MKSTKRGVSSTGGTLVCKTTLVVFTFYTIVLSMLLGSGGEGWQKSTVPCGHLREG